MAVLPITDKERSFPSGPAGRGTTTTDALTAMLKFSRPWKCTSSCNVEGTRIIAPGR